MSQHQNLSPQKLLDGCIDFLKDLKHANQANSFGTVLMTELKKEAFGIEPNKADSHSSKIDQLFEKYVRLFQNIGLEVSYAEGISAEAEIRINDSEQFGKFFNKLPDTNFTEEHKASLEPLILNLIVQFDQLCSADSLSETDTEIRESFRKIGETCRTLGYSEGEEVFLAGLALRELGIYNECKIASHINLSLAGGTFNPSVWHTDSTADNYQQRWDKLISDLTQISDNYVLSEQFESLWVEIVKQANQARDALNSDQSCTDRDSKLETLTRAFEGLKELRPDGD